MKKLLLSAFALAALTANAAVDLGGNDDIVIDGIMYLIDEETHEASVTGPGPTEWGSLTFYPEEVRIPETITVDGVEYTVTAVGEMAFYMSQNVRRVYCPDTVTTLGFKAFAAYGLQEVYLGNNITTVEENALTTIGYGDSLTDIFITTPTPPEIGETPNPEVRGFITVHVPGEYLEAYHEAWTGFKVFMASSLPDITLQAGESASITFAIPAVGSTAWSSSDASIASVNSYGVVTGVAKGTAVITARYGGNEVSCNVTVEGDTGAVENISIDNNAPTRYFNLQGVEITNPQKGQPVIIRQGGKSIKAIF